MKNQADIAPGADLHDNLSVDSHGSLIDDGNSWLLNVYFLDIDENVTNNAQTTTIIPESHGKGTSINHYNLQLSSSGRRDYLKAVGRPSAMMTLNASGLS